MSASPIAGAAAFLREIEPAWPRVAVVLGSGLGRFADELEEGRVVPYGDIPFFPRPTVIGHAGRLVIGRIGATPVVALQGRLHLYEGLAPEAVTFGVRVLHELGTRVLLLTTASGGIHRHYQAGDLMLLEDQINLQFRQPVREVMLAGAALATAREGGEPLEVCRGPVYSPRLIGIARRVAASLGLTNVHRGVFAGMLGPTYETPAEIRMAARFGADAVSMSVVLEALTARSLGMEVAGISAIVNVAAGLLDVPLDHEEVLEGARRMEPMLVAYLQALVPELAKPAP